MKMNHVGVIDGSVVMDPDIRVEFQIIPDRRLHGRD